MRHRAIPWAKGQTGIESLVEALTGTATGFVLSLFLQQALFPVLGHEFTYQDNLLISAAFTALSVLRSFLMRRLFNHLACRRSQVGEAPR